MAAKRKAKKRKVVKKVVRRRVVRRKRSNHMKTVGAVVGASVLHNYIKSGKLLA